MTFCRARALLLLWYMRLCRARYKWTGRAENVINPVVLNLGRTVLAYFWSCSVLLRPACVAVLVRQAPAKRLRVKCI